MLLVLLDLPTFDYAAPWVILRIGWSIPLVSTLVTTAHFLVGNREAEVKSTFLLTSTFPSFVFPFVLTNVYIWYNVLHNFFIIYCNVTIFP